MPNPTYTVRVLTAGTDGTNIYLEIQVSDGNTTGPVIRPVFESGTTYATIAAYLQAMATARPALDATIATLVGTSYTG